MALQRLGHQVDQDYVFDRSGLDPRRGRGCYSRDLARALTDIGFQIGPVWHVISTPTAGAELYALWQDLHTDLMRGIPSLVCMRADDHDEAPECFRLVVGYDAKRNEVLYHNPDQASGAYQRMAWLQFLNRWPLKYEILNWTVIRFSLTPGALNVPSPTPGFTGADYAQHIRNLKRRLPAGDFHMVIQPPFVVIGDEPAEVVERRATGTIRWAVERLKAKLFARDPRHILDIWLFKDQHSYNRNAEWLFGQKPTTPFGYYSPVSRALVMNISTGGGTLVHEIVHPFVESNFPRCPAWLNEGLGSLYEQCGERDGQIWGHPNWRLINLQQAIRTGVLPTFKELTETTRAEFYQFDPGTNYGQARYLCYYLQEKELLVRFFEYFRRNVREDPTGYASLKKVLGNPNMLQFQKQWETFVLELRYP